MWMLVLICISTSAGLARAECSLEEVFYEIKLLSIAEKNGIPIESKATQSFHFGECHDFAILELADNEIHLFDLQSDNYCSVKILASGREDLENLRKLVLSKSYWTKVSESFLRLRSIPNGCEIRVINANENVSMLMTGESVRIAAIHITNKEDEIPHFVSNRVNEYRYLVALFETWLKFKQYNGEVFIAGDQGFIVVSDQGRHFINYRDQRERKICSYAEVLARAKIFPEGVAMPKYLEGDDGDLFFLESLANYHNRSTFTAIGFGCNK